MATFDEVWREIQARLTDGTEVPNWSYDRLARGTTRIDRKYFDEIMISGRETAGSRPVKKTDFKKVFEFWHRYKQGLTPRDDIQQISRNSTYIFSILHWIETSQGRNE